jgi:hypothetical protein
MSRFGRNRNMSRRYPHGPTLCRRGEEGQPAGVASHDLRFHFVAVHRRTLSPPASRSDRGARGRSFNAALGGGGLANAALIRSAVMANAPPSLPFRKPIPQSPLPNHYQVSGPGAPDFPILAVIPRTPGRLAVCPDGHLNYAVDPHCGVTRNSTTAWTLTPKAELLHRDRRSFDTD